MKKPDLRGVTVATVLPFSDDLTSTGMLHGRLLVIARNADGIAAVFNPSGHGRSGSLSDERASDGHRADAGAYRRQAAVARHYRAHRL